MLTRGMTFAKSRMILTLALVAISGLYNCTQANYEIQPDSNRVTLHAHIITYSAEYMTDTAMIPDSTTGKMKMLITKEDPKPILMDGEEIYTPEQLYEVDTTAESSASVSSLTSRMVKGYLLSNMSKELSQLEDGEYFMGISNIVVDKKGVIVHFQFDGVTQTTSDNGVKYSVTIDEKLRDRFQEKVAELLQNTPSYVAAMYDGEPVNSIIENIAFTKSFSVKNKKLATE